MIHSLKAQGYSIRAIARMTGLNRRTVSKRLKEESLKPYKKRKVKSKLDNYKEYIENRIQSAFPDKIPSTVIYEEIKEMGYEGKIRILQMFLKKLYESHFPKKDEEVIRFETEPGFQAQCDWTILRKGKEPLYAFVMILGYSRFTYVEITDNMRQETFQQCHINAFEYFGGIPKTILYDNLKSVVIKRDKYGKNNHGFNDNFLDFSKTYKFIPKLCKPYRAQTKGKVERFNLYLKNNFYKPLKAKLKESGVEINKELLNAHLSSWLIKANNRIHSTTKEKPFVLLEKEKSHLISLEGILSHNHKQLNIKSENKKIIDKKNIFTIQISNENLEKIEEVLNINISNFTSLNDYESLISKDSLC